MRFPLRRACHIFGRSWGRSIAINMFKKILKIVLMLNLHNLIIIIIKINIKQNRKSPINPLLK